MKTVAMTYMRANPITTGHEMVYNRLIAVKDAEHYVFLSSSHDSKKNPLTPQDKLRFAKSVFKAAHVEIVAGGFIQAIKKVSPANKLVIIVGDDRIDDIRAKANKYNHKEFEFGEIEVKSAGTRLGNAISATKMRQWALDGDFDKFAAGCSRKMSDDEKRQMYELVRRGMGEIDNKPINESVLFVFD